MSFLLDRVITFMEKDIDADNEEEGDYGDTATDANETGCADFFRVLIENCGNERKEHEKSYDAAENYEKILISCLRSTLPKVAFLLHFVLENARN
jgi:hypothetical protein